jgi:type II secretory pathway pseudopilin PulG
MNAPPPQKKSVLPIILAVVGGVLVVGIVLVGILAALGIAGFRSYLSKAKTAEGQASVTELALGAARCGGTRGGKLPDSAGPVPASLSAVSGRKYMSAPTDWSADAFECASFSMGMPQYFQYEWAKRSDAEGTAMARADLDGDGTAEVVLEADVTCSGGRCSAAPVRQTR